MCLFSDVKVVIFSWELFMLLSVGENMYIEKCFGIIVIMFLFMLFLFGKFILKVKFLVLLYILLVVRSVFICLVW